MEQFRFVPDKRVALGAATLLLAALGACSSSERSSEEPSTTPPVPSRSARALPPSPATSASGPTTCTKIKPRKWSAAPDHPNPLLAKLLHVSPEDLGAGTFGYVECDAPVAYEEILMHAPAAILRVRGVGRDCLAIGINLPPNDPPQAGKRYDKLIALCPGKFVGETV